MGNKIVLDKPTHQHHEQSQRIKALEIAGRAATSELIRNKQFSDSEKKILGIIYPRWQPGITLTQGQIINYQGDLYEVLQSHTTQGDWSPENVKALYKHQPEEGEIPLWNQPAGGHDAYNQDDKVIYEGNVYKSLINANVWSPSSYPAGWELIGE